MESEARDVEEEGALEGEDGRGVVLVDHESAGAVFAECNFAFRSIHGRVLDMP